MSSADNAPTSRRVMREAAYASPEKLSVRKSIYRHAARPPPLAHERIRALIALRGDELVLDVGCGTGQDLAGLRTTGHVGPLVALDLSEGMVRAVGNNVTYKVVGDASALPIATDIADVVFAMSMLYHVPDIATAVAEFRRVLRRNGTVLVSTSSSHDKPEIHELWSAGLTQVAGRDINLQRQSATRFTAENGAEILGGCFSSVAVKPWTVTLHVPAAREIREYADSGRDFYESQLPDPSRWPDAMDIVERLAAERIERVGSFVVTIKKCVFICH